MTELATHGCANHPTEAAATRCSSCARALCVDCWRRNVDAAPWCEACIVDLERASGQRWALALTFLAFALAATFFGWRLETADGGEPDTVLWIGVVLGAVVGAAYLAFREGRRAHGRAITTRAATELPAVMPEARVGHPYRAGFRRVVRMVAPPLSGKATAVVLMLCMIVTAAALPAALRLSVWAELEMVALFWWGLWAIALSVLLHRGYRLSDDYVYGAPRLHLGGVARAGGQVGNLGCDAGCGEAAAALILLLAAFVAAWLLVELVVPAVFFLAYFLVRGALARVANDRHDCEGNLARSAGWGTAWATAYVAPLALVVWAVHNYARLR